MDLEGGGPGEAERPREAAASPVHEKGQELAVLFVSNRIEPVTFTHYSSGRRGRRLGEVSGWVLEHTEDDRTALTQDGRLYRSGHNLLGSRRRLFGDPVESDPDDLLAATAASIVGGSFRHADAARVSRWKSDALKLIPVGLLMLLSLAAIGLCVLRWIG